MGFETRPYEPHAHPQSTAFSLIHPCGQVSAFISCLALNELYSWTTPVRKGRGHPCATQTWLHKQASCVTM